MLKTLDILIGTVTILLLFSMAVTVITQAITAALNRKGGHLRDGIANLLAQLGVSKPDLAKSIAEKVLTHPMISVGGQLGTVIHRDELTKVLLDLAAGKGAGTIEQDAKEALVTILKDGGIADPAEALKNIHDMALQLEAANPGLANHVREGLAVIHGASSEFVARVHSWFDQAIDRVSERFTRYTHLVVVGVSLVVVLFVQLDIIAVMQRLSIDDQFRTALVQQASSNFSRKVSPGSGQADTTAPGAQASPGSGQSSMTGASDAGVPTLGSCQTQEAMDKIQKAEDDARSAAQKQADKEAASASKKAEGDALDAGKKTGKPEDQIKQAAKEAGEAAAASAKAASAGTINQAAKNARTDAIAQCQSIDPKPYYDLLNKAGLITVPNVADPGTWWRQLKDGRKLPGMFISVILLSLGAPFWYKVLGDLLRLRSALAGKDDAQRDQRQGAPAPDGGGPPAGNLTGGAAAKLPQGETGDLAAVG